MLTGSAKAPDGVEIRYEALGNGEPAIVFVHCWSCDRTYWSGQAAHFAASRRIVAIDLAGHGESGLGRQRYTVEAFGADVKAVVEALGLKRVVLVGRIAQDMAVAPRDVALSALESLIDYDEAAALAAVKAPLRLINTDRWPTDLAAAHKYKPDVQLAVMPGLGHFPMLEDPAEFNRLLERALKDLVTP